MNLYDMMSNISDINYIEEVEKVINEAKTALNGLVTERTCKIYNSYLYQELLNRHISVRLINTLDLDLSYEHYFVIFCVGGNYYIADLTFEQFGNINKDLTILLEKGYQEINDDLLTEYLSSVIREPIMKFTCENLFYMQVKKERAS